MTPSRFDAVFIGSSLVSLAAALAAAKRGSKVLLLPQQDRPAHFADGPLLHFGYEKAGAMEGYFSRLAISIPSLKKKGLRHHQDAPQLQVVLPRHRVNLHADEEATQAEFKREFPAGEKTLQRFFKQVARDSALYYPYVGQFPQLETSGMAERINEWKKQLDFVQTLQQHQKITATDLLHSYPFDKDLEHYFNLLSLFAKQEPLSKLRAFDLMEVIVGLQRGAHRLEGGQKQQECFFADLIKAHGGQIATGLEISTCHFSQKELSTLQLSDGSQISSPRFIVVPEVTSRRQDHTFSIKLKLIPPPLRSPMLLSWGDDRPQVCEDLIVLQKEHEPLRADTGYCTLGVSVLFREGHVQSDNQSVRDQLLKRLHWLMPFSESQILPLKTEGTEKTSPEALDQLVAETAGPHRRKTLQKGLLSYLEPRDKKNIVLLSADRSDFVSRGSAFLAGERLARWIETGK